MLQKGHFTEDNIVCFFGQLVLDGVVLGAPQQELLHQLVQLGLPGPALQQACNISQSSIQSDMGLLCIFGPTLQLA